jgi:hypothetical protein
MISTYNLFVTHLSHGKLPLPVKLHKKIISYAKDSYEEKNFISCIKGYQFHGNFDGKKDLEDILNNYFNRVFRLNISSGWLNILGNDSYNSPHHHNGTGGDFSGVYYMSNENNNINFTKDGDVFEIKPKIFDYLIFPSSLVHYILPENRKEKRICYAFNLTNPIVEELKWKS